MGTDEKECYLYRHFDVSGALLYVGISINSVVRLSQHRGKVWFPAIALIGIQSFPNRDAAIAAEKVAIMNEKPLFNIAYNTKPMKGKKPPKTEQPKMWPLEQYPDGQKHLYFQALARVIKQQRAGVWG